MSGNQRLYGLIGYEFTDERLLECALTHRSAGRENNERLEFLGDAVLGFVVADELYARFPGADEGQLSRLRAALVKKDALASLARKLELGKVLKLGAGELRSGGHSRDSILADGLEALIASVYLDGGYAAARALIGRVFARGLDSLTLDAQDKDPKTRLQEFLQAQNRPLPKYSVLDTLGDQHAQTFVVTCRLTDRDKETVGRGSSRRKAEQAAAAQLLEELEHEQA